MKKLNISFKTASVFDEVSLSTAYTGAKKEGDESDFQRIATVKADDELLWRLWTEVCGEVTDKFRGFLSESSLTKEAFNLCFELSSAHDDCLDSSIESDLFAALCAGVTGKWFGYSCPEKSREWEDKSRILLDRVLTKLCHRKRPRRPL